LIINVFDNPITLSWSTIAQTFPEIKGVLPTRVFHIIFATDSTQKHA
jgi:hypothetical protein